MRVKVLTIGAILLLSGICFGQAVIHYESDAFEVNDENWYASETGIKASITFYSSGPIRMKSIYSLDKVLLGCDSAFVRGYEWKDNKDKFKYKKVKKEDLEKPKKVNLKDKYKEDKDE